MNYTDISTGRILQKIDEEKYRTKYWKVRYVISKSHNPGYLINNLLEFYPEAQIILTPLPTGYELVITQDKREEMTIEL